MDFQTSSEFGNVDKHQDHCTNRLSEVCLCSTRDSTETSTTSAVSQLNLDTVTYFLLVEEKNEFEK